MKKKKKRKEKNHNSNFNLDKKQISRTYKFGVLTSHISSSPTIPNGMIVAPKLVAILTNSDC